MDSYKGMLVLVLIVFLSMFMRIAESENVNNEDDDITECPGSCGKFNNYRCTGNCTCVYVGNNENGTCYDFSGLDGDYGSDETAPAA
uniref:Evasin n=1 Tax=Rhipicephalus zambeziensis TaxID=60191 RepID=A0A224YI50_9ACAR